MTTTDFDFSDLIELSLPAPTPIGKDQVSVLTCTRGIATKTFWPTREQGFRAGKFFDLEQRAVNDIHDLYTLLNLLQHKADSFVIRGKPITNERKGIVRRSLGADATFRDAPCHWLCLDLDGVPHDPAVSLADSILGLVRATPLEGVSIVIQASSSWQIKPGLRAHIWVWLTEPRTSAQAAAWAASLPFKIDMSLFGAVQPHYTAAPVFRGGRGDPVSERVFLLTGDSPSLYIPAGTVEEETAHWVAEILALGHSGNPRHPVHNRAAYSLGGWAGAGLLDATDIEEVLIAACEESGAYDTSRLAGARDEIRRALADGIRHPRQGADWKQDLIRSEEGVIKLLPANYISIFSGHPQIVGRLGYDVRELKTLLLSPPPWARDGERYPRELTDGDDARAAAWLNRLGVHTSALGQVSAALSAAAEGHPVDRVVQWLDALPPWDMIARMDTWLSTATGCNQDAYHAAAGRKMLIALVARAYTPGCKCDDMLVLVGPQGARKSTLLNAISTGPGAWAFSDCLGDIRRPQDYIPSLMGPWLIEVADLATFSKREVDVVKKFLSTASDRHRLSYGRRAVDIPRRCVISGTSNPAEFLSDPTGNRRFWPVDTRVLNIQWVIDNRDQLFAEAIMRYRAGERWYLEGAEIPVAVEQQEYHTAPDPWEDGILEFLDSPPVNLDPDCEDTEKRVEVTMDELLVECLEIPRAQATHQHARRIGAILKRLGWEKTRPRVGHRRQTVYKRENEN